MIWKSWLHLFKWPRKWIVIGGADKGGIIVREDEDLRLNRRRPVCLMLFRSSSALNERLEYGALLEETQRIGSKVLTYRRSS